MRVPNLLKQLAIFFTAFCASAISATAQQPQNQNPDVIRVNTSLVQTDVMVFDKQGKFVDELKREQFVLKVDGKPREISFFELVKAGSSNEEAQLAAARGVASKAGTPAPLDRGRPVFFFIDDLHLSEESMHHTRKTAGAVCRTRDGTKRSGGANRRERSNWFSPATHGQQGGPTESYRAAASSAVQNRATSNRHRCQSIKRCESMRATAMCSMSSSNRCCEKTQCSAALRPKKMYGRALPRFCGWLRPAPPTRWLRFSG